MVDLRGFRMPEYGQVPSVGIQRAGPYSGGASSEAYGVTSLQVAPVRGGFAAAGGCVGAFGGMSGLNDDDPNAIASAGVAPGQQVVNSVLNVKFAGQMGLPCDNLYMNGLPSGIDQPTLIQMFTSHGFQVLRSRIVPDTKRVGTTAAMVQVSSVEEATLAIETFNGQSVVGAAAPGSGTGIAAGGGGAWAAGDPCVLHVKFAGMDGLPNDNLYITGLPTGIDIHTLNETFVSLGFTVRRSRVIPDTRGTGRGAGMVQLGSVEEAAMAIEQLNGQFVAAPPGEATAPSVIVPPNGGYANGSSSAVKAAGKAPGIGQWSGGSLGKAGGATETSGRVSIRYAGTPPLPGDNLYISGLPLGIDLETLKYMFVSAGFTVLRSRLVAAGVAMVQVGSAEEAAGCIAQFQDREVLLGDEEPTVADDTGKGGDWDEAGAKGSCGFKGL